MLVLGVESSCDETGIALYDSAAGLLSHALHSQVAMHAEYGGVVPELASRDHIRRVVPLLRDALSRANRDLADIDAVAYTRGPGLAGALVGRLRLRRGTGCGAGQADDSGASPRRPPALAAVVCRSAGFPFVALLVSGGHTQLMRVTGVGEYELLGETLDDAAGEAFDKSAKLLGLPYPGGALLSKLADQGTPGAYELPRPMLHSGDLSFSFSGLKTAVLTLVREQGEPLTDEFRADAARAFQEAIVEVLVKKSLKALKQTGLKQLVVAGGVGANRQLRATLDDEAKRKRFRVHYPELEFCTDNGAMIALAGCLRLQAGTPAKPAGDFAVQPRWPLMDMAAGGTK